MACCMKSIAISKPKSSPATRVNLLMIEHAPNTAITRRRKDVHTQTLPIVMNTYQYIMEKRRAKSLQLIVEFHITV